MLGNYEHGLFVATLCVPVISTQRVCNVHGRDASEVAGAFLAKCTLVAFR